MAGFYLTLIAVLVSGLGSRDQLTVARLTARQGQRPAVLILAIAVAILSAGFAAWAAGWVAPLLVPAAREVLVAMALAFAGIEMLVAAPVRRLGEPTQSLGALALVLMVRQVTDAARFLVFAIAAGTNAPIAAGAGGALGGVVLVGAAWFLSGAVQDRPLARLRRVAGGLLIGVAFYAGVEALDLV